MDEDSDQIKRLEALEKKTSQNRWTIILLASALICLTPPLLAIISLSMLDISDEVSTPQGKLIIKSHPLSEELLIKIASGIGAAAIGGLALAGRSDVIEALVFNKKKDDN